MEKACVVAIIAITTSKRDGQMCLILCVVTEVWRAKGEKESDLKKGVEVGGMSGICERCVSQCENLFLLDIPFFSSFQVVTVGMSRLHQRADVTWLKKTTSVTQIFVAKNVSHKARAFFLS